MKRVLWLGLMWVMMTILVGPAFGLSESLPRPKLFLPKGYDAKRAEQVHAVLTSDQFKYLDGMTSYWEPHWSTTLVYEGNSENLSAFIAALSRVEGIAVRLTFSQDLAKETGSALRAGSWWVKYSHTTPDTLTVRINLAAETLGREKFALNLAK